MAYILGRNSSRKSPTPPLTNAFVQATTTKYKLARAELYNYPRMLIRVVKQKFSQDSTKELLLLDEFILPRC
jgi:hypothetical protein